MDSHKIFRECMNKPRPIVTQINQRFPTCVFWKKARKQLKLWALVLLLGSSTFATENAGVGLDPALHPPGGRIEFNRKCANEDPYRVKAYARMESHHERARAVVAILVGYPAAGGEAIRLDVRLQRLKIDGGSAWQNQSYTIRLLASSDSSDWAGPEIGSFHSDQKGPQPFRTGEAGTADWITFIEPGEKAEGAERFYHHSPGLGFTMTELGVDTPDDEFSLALQVRTEQSGETIRLPGPRVRVPERVWAMSPPDLQPLGLLETLDWTEEGSLPRTLYRAWKYRQCIEERRAAKRFLGQHSLSIQIDKRL